MLMLRSLLGVLLLSCGFSVFADVQNIDNAKLEEMLAKGVPIVDIRRAEEWKSTGIVNGSHKITFFDAQGKYDLLGWLKEFLRVAGPTDPVILICRTGNRTSNVARLLDQRLGYTQILNVEKGIVDWIANGKPVVSP